MAPTVGQQPSLVSIVFGASPVVQLVLLMLIAFSVGSLGVILFKFRQLRAARRQSERFLEIFWEAKNLAAIHNASVELKQSPVAHVFRSGYQELQRLTRPKKSGTWGDAAAAAAETTDLGGIDNVERAMRRATTQEVTRLEKALTFLATTASTAPFVGLFGTVWGVMTAFRGLTTAQTSSIQAVAPGIAEALIATAVGLAAAIPAVVAFNHFAREIRVLTADMENFSAEFLNIAERHFI
jgi:biopolymer transport protein TolQ